MLRRTSLVVSHRRGGEVVYSLSVPGVPDLLLVLAGFFALQQTAWAVRLDEEPWSSATTLTRSARCSTSTSSPSGSTVRCSFAAAHDFLLEVAEVSAVRVVVLRMSRVTTIDATGASVLADTIRCLEKRGITVLLSGVRSPHERVLRELGVHDHLAHERHLFASTPDAIAHARLCAARVEHADPRTLAVGRIVRTTTG